MQELGYTGYERLRRGFDRAFGGQDSVPKFSLVVDAGCGTGLVGEQVRSKRLTLESGAPLMQFGSFPTIFLSPSSSFETLVYISLELI